MQRRTIGYVAVTLVYLSACLQAEQADPSQKLPGIGISDDGTHFVVGHQQQPFIVWGVNYDHDREGQLLEDYWHDHWTTIEEDFREIKQLGANTVRVHLQLGKFMTSAEKANTANLEKLKQLVALAERTGLYLDITGLACYHKQDVPSWYDGLSEDDRWQVQKRFWRAVAGVCRESPAIFCYDLMNEPILPGKTPETDWLAGSFGGKHFVQRISLDLAGRSRNAVAAAWVRELTTAIRSVDDRHLVTVGVIPWAHVWKNAKSLFHSEEIGKPLDFVSVHFYPKKGDIAGSLAALKVYELGKPLVVEEIFPLKCGLEETAEFIEGPRPFTDGWISFYWGQTVEECQEEADFTSQIMAKWLVYFQSKSP